MSSRLFLFAATILVALVTLTTQVQAISASGQKSILQLHNKVRAIHHAPPLTWDKKLAAYAQNWTNKCVFQHSGGPYGENLAEGYENWEQVIVKGWYGEVSNYNYNKPGFSMNTGHFTQVVWKATTKVGCGVQTCNGSKMYTCSYEVPGNMVGDNNEYFIQNVLAP